MADSTRSRLPIPLWAVLALGLFLAGLAAPQVSAQVLRAAHDTPEWEADRQSPYAGSGWRESEGGSPSETFESVGVQLRSWLTPADLDPAATEANDCWGYVSPSGREYALIGLSTGTAIVEVSDPGDAQLVSFVAGPNSGWRDIKTYGAYAYAVSEGGGGIQVIDLGQVDAGVVTLVNTVITGGSLHTHDVAVNTESGRLYRLGGPGSLDRGLRIYHLDDPALPVFEGYWNDRYCHDAQVVTWTEAPFAGTEVAFCFANDDSYGGNPGIEILDVTDPASVSVIGSINLAIPPIFSHPASYSHQGWLSVDRRYVYFNDETDESVSGTPTTTRVIDVSDLSNPVQAATFSNGNTARDHNLFTWGSLIFEANYRSGLRVFDASDPLAPVEIAWFDTYPDDDDAHYNGLWGVYPFLPSGTVIGSDIERGLFVWTIDAVEVPSASAVGLLVAALALGATGARSLRSQRLRRDKPPHS
jgi:choice-of-anchor B domain-containing protein